MRPKFSKWFSGLLVLFVVLAGYGSYAATAQAEGIPELETKVSEFTGFSCANYLFGSSLKHLKEQKCGAPEAKGYDNTLIGIGESQLTTGSYNTFVGGLSGQTATSLSESTIVGSEAGQGLKEGSYIELYGGDTMGRGSVTNENDVMAFGVSATECWQGNASHYGHDAFFGQGVMAGYYNGSTCTETTSGEYDACLGNQALAGGHEASDDTCIGFGSLGAKKGGADTALGQGSLEEDGEGDFNTAVGAGSGQDTSVVLGGSKIKNGSKVIEVTSATGIRDGMPVSGMTHLPTGTVESISGVKITMSGTAAGATEEGTVDFIGIGVRDTYVGNNAGQNNTGDNNVCLGYAECQAQTEGALQIGNGWYGKGPLIEGSFGGQTLKVNGELKATTIAAGTPVKEGEIAAPSPKEVEPSATETKMVYVYFKAKEAKAASMKIEVGGVVVYEWAEPKIASLEGTETASFLVPKADKVKLTWSECTGITPVYASL